MIAALLYGAAAVIIIATALPLAPWRMWWIRVCDFPRTQLVILAVLVGGVWPVLHPPVSAAPIAVLTLLAAALVHQIWCIVPYTRLWPTQASSSRSADAASGGSKLRILVSNVQMQNRDADALRALIADTDPDIVLALEPDDWWANRLAPLSAVYPHAVARPQDNTYGMLLYSKRPLHDTAVRELTKRDVPSIRTDVELGDGRRVRFYALHPPPPMLGHAADSLSRDAELVRVAREVAASARPTIVAGDLNDVAWSRTTRLFQRLSRLLDPRVGRGMYNSFHAKFFFARWPLDHVFFSDAFHLVALERLGSIGSDHFPLLVTLTLTPERSDLHDGPPPADSDDRSAARSIIDAAPDPG